MKSVIFVAIGCMGFALGLPLRAAQDEAADIDQPTAATAAVCELHVWPAGAVRSTYNGWFHGGIVDGAIQGRDGYRKLPESILSTEAQAKILRELDLAAILQLPDYAVVVHDYPLPSRAIRTTAGRLLPASPPCYAELVTDDVFFQEDVFAGQHLKAIFRFRQFDGSDASTRSFGAYQQHKLEQFPPKEPEQLDVALEEFRLAYGKTVSGFGEALNRPPKKKKK